MIIKRRSKYTRPLSYYYDLAMREKQARGSSESTLLRYRTAWEHQLREFWEDIMPREINRDTYTEFLIWHTKRKKEKQLINANKVLKIILSYLRARGIIEEKNTPEIYLTEREKQHHRDQKGSYITSDEVLLYISALQSERDKTIVELAYSTGMRVGEICHLRKSQFRRDGDVRYIYLSSQDTKTRKPREIPLTAALYDRLSRFMRPETDYLFSMRGNRAKPVSTKAVSEAFRKAVFGVSGVSKNFHSLRHSAATNFAKAGVLPQIACALLGMSLHVYQTRYLKLKARDLAETMKLLTIVRGEHEKQTHS